MNLILDIGNSSVKYSVFDRGEEISASKVKQFDLLVLDGLLTKFPHISAAIISSVRTDVLHVYELLKSRLQTVILLDERTPVPVRVCYKTPHTLGKDRLAAVVGASVIFPNENVLIFDSGTALTIELLDAQGNYLGGNISPGLHMRFAALHQFTQKLPRLHMNPKAPLLGEDTNSAIEAGVQQGILGEVLSYIRHYEEIYTSLKVVFTGGDAFFFVGTLKNRIFVVSNLVQIGLNRILEDYVEKNLLCASGSDSYGNELTGAGAK